MKRLMDVALLVMTSPVWVPLVIAVALSVWLMMRRPIFFTQFRPGLRGRPFRLVKFRTMQLSGGQGKPTLSDAERLMRFGRFLRSTSLDELPELWNVLKGDMSLVGPRPLLMEYLSLYSAEQNRRHDVRPGLTGWAQINGRNALSWEDKFALDVWYVDHQSMRLDLAILLRTIARVVTRHGISAEGEATVQPFRGARTT